jgi:hypothetical protein
LDIGTAVLKFNSTQVTSFPNGQTTTVSFNGGDGIYNSATGITNTATATTKFGGDTANIRTVISAPDTQLIQAGAVCIGSQCSSEVGAGLADNLCDNSKLNSAQNLSEFIDLVR